MTYDGLPASITVGAVAYRVIVDPSIGSDGEYSARQCTIRIKPDLALPYARQVIMHEWLHALYEHGGLTAEGSKPDEEATVSALGWAGLESMRANPDLLKFLTTP